MALWYDEPDALEKVLLVGLSSAVFIVLQLTYGRFTPRFLSRPFFSPRTNAPAGRKDPPGFKADQQWKM